MVENYQSTLPPGFRFHPTDEELIVHYLRNQVMSKPCPVSIIPEVDIYKYDPWQLPKKAEFGENEWYFFSPRDRKYPKGYRPNRAAVSGYWKATGTDKPIFSGTNNVGVKKALVFYKGRPPKGTKTDWIMHEYRVYEPRKQYDPRKHFLKPIVNGSMRLDEWVLCRIYKKKIAGRLVDETEGFIDLEQMDETVVSSDEQKQEQEIMKLPRTSSLAHLLEPVHMEPISHILAENSINFTPFDFQNHDNIFESGGFGYYQLNQGEIINLHPPVFQFH